MIFYLLFAAFAVGGLMGGGAVNWFKDAQIARHEQAQVAAQAKIDAQAAKIQAETENKLIDMGAAFDAGEANAKTITKTVYLKGQEIVRDAPAFSNPQCVLPDTGLQLHNSEAARVRAAAAEALGITLPTAGRPEDGAVRGSVRIQTGASGAVPGVPQELRGVSSGSGTSGQGVQRPPKPSPK